MTTGKVKMISIGLLSLAAGGQAVAQDTPDDAAVWAVIEAQWEASEKGDAKWIGELLTDDFVGWTTESPAPRSKDSVRMWQKFESKQWQGKVHELYPLSIVVHGDTAIAHYLYSNAGESADGKTEVVHGRYTDVLVREDGDWKFIAWHGGSDDE